MIDKLSVIHQQPHDLVLAVGPPVASLSLTILAQHQLRHNAWLVTLAIIGESHSVCIQHPHHDGLQEILACVAVPADWRVHSQSFETLHAHSFAQAGYETAVSFDVEPPWPLPSEDAPHIAFDFPSLHGRIPRTAIYWQTTADSVGWWTLHTYIDAQQTTYVHTHSRFDFTHFERS